MRVEIRTSDDLIKRYANATGAMGKQNARKAFARAINRTTSTVYIRVVRSVAKQSSIPQSIVRKSISKRIARPSGNQELEGVVWATGSPLPLKVFKPRQFKWGVRVKLFGKMRRMEGTFIYAGTYNSGNTVAGGHVFQRVTRAGLPIEKQYGPSVPEEMVKGATKQEFERTVQEVLPRRVAHEINRLLPNN